MSISDRPALPRPPATANGWSDGAAPSIAAAAPGVSRARPVSERCDHCSAPVEPAQRYCVQCGAHQRRADDPTARWFASARRARAAQSSAGSALPAANATGRTVSAGVAAVLIALLPVAAGVGVLVGRGSDHSGKAVVEALKAAGAAGGFAASATAASATTPDGAAATGATDDPAKDDTTSEKVSGVEVSDEQAPILATGPAGSARKLTGTKPTTKDLKESKQALDQIESKKGEDYVEQQKDLPDTIVIP